MEKRTLSGVKEKGVRDRSGSMGTLEDMWKRRSEERGEGEGEEAFRSSKKILRSPDVEKSTGEGLEDVMRRVLREELEGIREKIKEVGRWKEEFKKLGGDEGGDEGGIKSRRRC